MTRRVLASSILMVMAAGLLPASGRAGPGPSGQAPIVVVFGLETKRVRLDPALLDGLGDHLATLLTRSGQFQVVPRDELRARLNQQKVKSYKACYDQSCQVELGRELAAEKTVSTQIIKLGKHCTLNLTLYDLRRAATEKAASQRGGCGEEEIVQSIEKAVAELVGSRPGPAAAQPAAAGSGTARIVGNVQGARVSVDGLARGFAPLTVEDLLPGEHLARLEAEGYEPGEARFAVRSGEQALVQLELAAKGSGGGFGARLKSGLGKAVDLGGQAVGVGREIVTGSGSDDRPSDKAGAGAADLVPDEVQQPDGAAVWLRCPIGQEYDGRECTGQASALPFSAARGACPNGFKLPAAEDFIGLLGPCDSGVGSGQDGTCAACQASEACRALFGDDEQRYWTFSWDPASGTIRTVSLAGQVGSAQPAELLPVRCLRKP